MDSFSSLWNRLRLGLQRIASAVAVRALSRGAGLPAAARSPASLALLSLGAKYDFSCTTTRLGHPSDLARVELAPSANRGTALLALVIRIEVLAGAVSVRLLSGYDSAVDQVVCSARPNAYELALFAAPNGCPLQIAVAGAKTPAKANLLHLSAFACAPGTLAPKRLMRRQALAAVPEWPRVYGNADPEDAAARLRQRVFAELHSAEAVPWIEDLAVQLHPGDELSRALFISGLYEPETMLAIRRLLPRGGVFVDIGAHCGIYTIFASRRVGRTGRVIAFEPSSREFARLAANVALNRLANVMTERAAIADRCGSATLRVAESGHAGHNTIGTRFAYDGVNTETLEEVPVTTLDSYFSGQALARCDVIKMDIEGAEFRALAGAKAMIARLRPALVLEVFESALAANAGSVADLAAMLARLDYAVHDIDPRTAELLPVDRLDGSISKNIVALPR